MTLDQFVRMVSADCGFAEVRTVRKRCTGPQVVNLRRPPNIFPRVNAGVIGSSRNRRPSGSQSAISTGKDMRRAERTAKEQQGKAQAEAGQE